MSSDVTGSRHASDVTESPAGNHQVLVILAAALKGVYGCSWLTHISVLLRRYGVQTASHGFGHLSTCAFTNMLSCFLDALWTVLKLSFVSNMGLCCLYLLNTIFCLSSSPLSVVVAPAAGNGVVFWNCLERFIRKSMKAGLDTVLTCKCDCEQNVACVKLLLICCF